MHWKLRVASGSNAHWDSKVYSKYIHAFNLNVIGNDTNDSDGFTTDVLLLASTATAS